MNQSNENLSQEERDAIAGLPREAAPPPPLEETTVAALAARGLLRPRTRRDRRPLELGLAAAAALLLFAGGYLAGNVGGEPPAAELPSFLLLLYEGPEYQVTAEGREMERVREYGEWAEERGARGELESGEKLRDEADLVLRPDGSVVSVPSTPAEPRLTGFFLIKADDDRSALEIARSCPHLRYGGSIVIREIEPTWSATSSRSAARHLIRSYRHSP